jgi:hypothetical protein
MSHGNSPAVMSSRCPTISTRQSRNDFNMPGGDSRYLIDVEINPSAHSKRISGPPISD